MVILGDKGEMSGGMTARFPKSTIETIDRASEKARDRAKARTEAAETHAAEILTKNEQEE